MAKEKRKRDGDTSGIVFALWGKTPGELDDAEWDRYRRLTRTTSYYRRHERNKAQQRKDKSWVKVDILKVLGIPAACSRCGYDKYIGALDFHHRDPKEKSGAVNSVEEARKCDLLCANCHREAHRDMREEGHKIEGAGRPREVADPWLAEYMRLSGLSAETIEQAHKGRPGDVKRDALNNDRIALWTEEARRQAAGVCLSCLQMVCTCGRLVNALSCSEPTTRSIVAGEDKHVVVHDVKHIVCKTSGTRVCTCPPNGICNDCTVDVSLW
jgi:predicted Zn-ribbon and HTH transcriptional regulator